MWIIVLRDDTVMRVFGYNKDLGGVQLCSSDKNKDRRQKDEGLFMIQLGNKMGTSEPTCNYEHTI